MMHLGDITRIKGDRVPKRYKKYGNPLAVKKNGVVILLDD